MKDTKQKAIYKFMEYMNKNGFTNYDSAELQFFSEPFEKFLDLAIEARDKEIVDMIENNSIIDNEYGSNIIIVNSIINQIKNK